MQSTPKIDIWSLGLMLHGFVFGFLPFNKADRLSLEKQIIQQELGYKHIKRLKTSTIKDPYRKSMNLLLKKTSDGLIDLIAACDTGREEGFLARVNALRRTYAALSDAYQANKADTDIPLN